MTGCAKDDALSIDGHYYRSGNASEIRDAHGVEIGPFSNSHWLSQGVAGVVYLDLLLCHTPPRPATCKCSPS